MQASGLHTNSAAVIESWENKPGTLAFLRDV